MNSAETSHSVELTEGTRPWPLTTLRDICDINPRRKPDLGCADDDAVSFVPMAAVDAQAGTIKQRLERPFSEVRKGFTYFEDGDVIFAKITPCMQNGKHAICGSLLRGFGFGSTEFHVLRAGPRLRAEWLHYFLRQPQLLREAQEHFTGAVGQQRVPETYLAELEIPLPSVAEQDRLAENLMRALAAVDVGRRAAEDRLAAAESLPAAYLRDVFDTSEECTHVRLGDCCELLPSKSIATEGDTEVRAITTACLSEQGFLPSGVKTARMRGSDVSTCLVQSGEVLVARSNTPELVGRAAVYKGEPAGVVASDLTIRVWPRKQICGDYLGAFLSYLYQTGYWRERAGGASGTMKKITRQQLLSQQIPMPSGGGVEQQRRIAADLSRRIESARSLIAHSTEELAAIDAIPASLLRAAFNGNS